ncbi:DUF1189 family protein [Vagococcus vulneris]|nr:DUF1189 family protein [Vagococcus vulneris]
MKNFISISKSTFKNPAQLLQYRNKRGIAVFGYIVLLSIIMSLPLIFETVRFGQTLQRDSLEILKKTPDFKINNDTLTTSKKDAGFVYQTDSIIFTFDPDNNRTKHEVAEDAEQGVIAVGLLKNDAVVSLPANGTASDIVESFNTSYKSMPLASLINKDFITDLVTQKSNIITFIIITCVFAFVLIAGNFLFNLFFLTLFASISNKIRNNNLTFGNTFKLLVYCSTIPSIVTVILQFLLPSLPFSTIGLIMTIFIYFSIFPKITKKSS